MNYVLDLRTITDHFPGIGRYGFNLAQAIASLLERSERLILLRDPTAPSRWDVSALASERVRVIEAPLSPFSFCQQWVIPSLLRRLTNAGDHWLYHSLYYLMPYRPGIPAVFTCYDLIPLICPRYFSPLQRLVYRLAHRLALSTACVVLAISEATKADLIRHFSIASDQVVVTPLAADTRFTPRSPEEVAAVRQKYTLSDPYVLYIGSNKPHKNLVRLVEALSRQPSPITLVIGGTWDHRYPQARQRAYELGMSGRVRWLGPVPECDLPALYSGAILFAFPSEYEGFGLPVLEAMACGTPVVCSRTSSLPELAGDAALLVDPLDVEEIATGIRCILEDEELRWQMRERGLMRAALFSWERTARMTLAAYERALSGT
ncbi:MAG: glycosyltransferase family 1 protein [Anaerolineae bacterium]|nr:glycosyltransferase family 4 protein [Anaerolineae bacterium]MDW8099822.1 glycosyltransferase family 1 protein [Anaerolineae bacterium]